MRAETSPRFLTVFGVLFEIVSAYGTVGLSLGYDGKVTSLAGEFGIVSKLVLICLILAGRHRGLPYAVDSAVYLPSLLNTVAPRAEPPDIAQMSLAMLSTARSATHRHLPTFGSLRDVFAGHGRPGDGGGTGSGGSGGGAGLPGGGIGEIRGTESGAPPVTGTEGRRSPAEATVEPAPEDGTVGDADSKHAAHPGDEGGKKSGPAVAPVSGTVPTTSSSPQCLPPGGQEIESASAPGSDGDSAQGQHAASGGASPGT